MEATAQVLRDVGLEAMSTNKIAARAGVAIGSIYQYFPDKEALLDALIDDRVQRLETLAASRIESMRTRSYPEAAEAMLRATIEFCVAEPELSSILFTRIAVPSHNPRHVAASNNVQKLTRNYLLECGDHLKVHDVDLAAAISTHVIARFAPWIALTVQTERERDHFIAEIVRMLSLWIGATE